MEKLTQDQFQSLKRKLYETFMILPMWDEETGEKIEPGIGEMGNAEEAAEALAREWAEENNLEILD